MMAESGSQVKVLIVEDNPLNMRLIEMTLRTGGYHLLRAADGEDALAMARKEKPSLIIMDIQLPGMSGLEVTRLLRRSPEFAGTPIIALTAYAMKGDETRFLEAGCSAYVPKPIDIRKFPKLVADMLSRGSGGG
ncbi:MAG: response regulator [Dehalococcoidales bacterium]|nr:response regulator [Dehalococcoidales bacterium]